jgi:hypothetical protein
MFMKNWMASEKSLAQSGVMSLADSGAPVDGTSGTGAGIAGPMSSYTDITNFKSYVNIGTLASPVWSQEFGAGVLLKSSGTISAANLVGTGVGQFGHANGVVLQAAPGASLALQFIAVGMYYTFATAAYTAGGNITVNWGAGGAALTGLVSAANSVGAAASKAIQFFPLTTAGVAIVSNVSLNLVSSAAFTQPGTAAGTIAWELWYRVMSVGF